MLIKKLVLNDRCDIKSIVKKEIEIVLAGENKKYYYKGIKASGTKATHLFIYEEYYLRTNSDLTVTVVAETDNDKTVVELISSGGGVGFISSNFGTEKSSLKSLYSKLTELGFEEV